VVTLLMAELMGMLHMSKCICDCEMILQHVTTLKKCLTQFWCAMKQSYQNLTMLAFRCLLPFLFTYLCEAGFSTLVHINTKLMNRVDVDRDVGLAFTSMPPRISRHPAQMQANSYRWLTCVLFVLHKNVNTMNLTSKIMAFPPHRLLFELL